MLPTESVDLDDPVVALALGELLLHAQQLTVRLPQATTTNRFVDQIMLQGPKWDRLQVGRILLTDPISAAKYKQAAAFLKTIAGRVFGVIKRGSDLEWAKASGLNNFVLPDTFEGFPERTTFITKW
jgi:hypothetical protein